MPIRPENKGRYPANWKAISLAVREAAGWCCEFCGIAQHTPTKTWKVILTVAHLDNTPENCARENLKALCQRCHLEYDRPIHIANLKRTNLRKFRERTGQLPIPSIEVENSG